MKRICSNCMRSVPAAISVCPLCGFDVAAYRFPKNSLPPETILRGRYLLGRTLGIGGFGITYLGLDLTTGRKVAVKEHFPAQMAQRILYGPGIYRVIPSDEEKSAVFDKGVQGYLTEGRHLAMFQNVPSIVSVLEYFTENGTAYLVMDYIDGVPLQRYLKKWGGRLDINQVLALLRPILGALILMHDRNLIHRDVSPDNIMVTGQGQAVLIDFGASERFDNPEHPDYAALKPGYAALEQYIREMRQGPWTDEYGFCATLYRAVTGIIPADGKSRRERDTLLPPSAMGISIHPVLERILMKGLEVEAQNRYPGLKEFSRALLRAYGIT